MFQQKSMEKKKVLLIWATTVLFLFYSLVPVVWAFIISITPERYLYTYSEEWFPSNISLSRYIAILTGTEIKGTYVTRSMTEPFLKALINSIVISLSVTFLSIMLGLPSSFAFKWLKFPCKRILFSLIIFIIVSPIILLLPSIFVIYKQLNLLDTKLGLILLYLGWGLPYTIWILKSYFDTIPKDIFESALMDGCTYTSMIYKIFIPLSAPGIVAGAIMSFLLSWNEFLSALILTNTLSSKTFPVVLAEFVGEYSIDYNTIATGAIIACIPALLFTVFLQKYMIKGLTSGAIKG